MDDAHLHLLSALLMAPYILRAQGAPGDTAVKVTFGGFVDAYYAFDFNRPAGSRHHFSDRLELDLRAELDHAIRGNLEELRR